jgi:hypothetical protein
MVRAAVFAVTLAGLTLLAAGVLDASPLVFWSTTEEFDAVEHGRRAMLAGAGVTAAAAVALAALGERRAAALLAVAVGLPVGAVVAAGHSALGLLVLAPALAAGLAAAIRGCARPGDRGRLVPSAVLGIVALGAAAVGGLAWGAVVAAALTLGAYLHARARGAEPRAALASLAPGMGVAVLAASAVLAGGALAA